MFKSNFIGIFLAVYCHLSLHFVMSIIVDKWKINIYNWTKHTYLSCVLRRLREALDWIQKTFCSLQSKLLKSVYCFVIIGGWQFCFRPKGILPFHLPLFFLQGLSGSSDCFLKINEHSIDSVPWWSFCLKLLL